MSRFCFLVVLWCGAGATLVALPCSGSGDVRDDGDVELAVVEAGFTNSVGMKFVRIPCGTFTMGSDRDDTDADDNERPAHAVEISKDFYLGVTEVTQGQFRQVMGFNPSYFSRDGKPGPKGDYSRSSGPGQGKDKVKGFTQKELDDFPVENVSWDDAGEFLEKLSDLPEEKAAGRKYVLPTEAQWEYACRGGEEGKTYHVGDTLSKDHANFNDHVGRTTTVGSYAPNAWGLYDMHGNVWEWCQDWFDGKYYANSPKRDPLCLKGERLRTNRGGTWANIARHGRTAFRNRYPPEYRIISQGFRAAVVEGR